MRRPTKADWLQGSDLQPGDESAAERARRWNRGEFRDDAERATAERLTRKPLDYTKATKPPKPARDKR